MPVLINNESTQTIGFSPQTKFFVLKNSVGEEKTPHSLDLQTFCIVAWELFNHEDYYLSQEDIFNKLLHM